MEAKEDRIGVKTSPEKMCSGVLYAKLVGFIFWICTGHLCYVM